MPPIQEHKKLAREFFPRLGYIGQQSQVASTLDFMGQLTLVTGAGAGLAAGANLALFRHETAQHIDLFVIDLNIFINTELAEFGARDIATTPHRLLRIHRHIIGHDFFSD
jgi:hypothetical protein